MHRLTTIGAAMALLLCACSDGDSNSDGPDAAQGIADAAQSATDAAPQPDAAPELTPIEAFCAEDGPYAALVEGIGECGGFFAQIEISGTDLFRGAALTRFCTEQFGALIESGTAELDPSAFAECKNYAETAGCEVLQSSGFVGSPCQDIFLGTVALGDACDDSSQCIGDAFCDTEFDSCGLCVARRADGEACDNDEQCTNGLCNNIAECATPGVIGDACTSASDCAGLLECRDDVCASALPKVGDVCNSQGDCSGPAGEGIPFEIGLYCAPGANKGDEPTCQPAPAVGDACVPQELFDIPFDLQQDLCDVRRYEWCDNGTCVAAAVSDVGGPCNIFAITGSGARRCAPGLACTNPIGGIQGDVGECQEVGYEGDVCDTSGDSPRLCSPFYECDGEVCRGNTYEPVCEAE